MTAPTTPAVSAQGREYLAAVDRQLADLPEDDRTALLEDLALHLEAMSHEDDDRPVAVRLGAPAAYAADLRAAAGLPARASAPDWLGAGTRDRLDRVLATHPAREARRLVADLRPAWWVLRGYLLVAVPCLLQIDGVDDFPVPAPFGSQGIGLVLVAAAVAGSFLLGRQTLPRALGALVAAGGLLLAVLALLIAQTHGDRLREPVYVSVSQPAALQAQGQFPLLSRSGPVTDVLPYAADGTPLEGVLLYDQDGRPLQVGVQEWWADGCYRVLEQPQATDGVPVPQSFPQNYVVARTELDRYGVPLQLDRCTAGQQRPEVPLPVFPTPAAPSPDATAVAAAPTPGG
ncbi:hypothetical protein GB931_08550 [Modestobacter sp. I12A-02628]|uniref:Uncharacterized protein n=1 Tax=Goekera deserti TaxID=2497753 RepID=A0A7K3WEZ3_9ACTN|nr:hypothetical protein [Goekera deserti]MPQ97970.1 hypothetical protein [Goekera deserti]NDI48617.1 hypothetical protein [Goekera deserti]NEL55004.1 hypothetical protein [Goekera deserti]